MIPGPEAKILPFRFWGDEKETHWNTLKEYIEKRCQQKWVSLRARLHGEFQPRLKFHCDHRAEILLRLQYEFQLRIKTQICVELFTYMRKHSRYACSRSFFSPGWKSSSITWTFCGFFSPFAWAKNPSPVSETELGFSEFSPGWNFLHVIGTFISRAGISFHPRRGQNRSGRKKMRRTKIRRTRRIFFPPAWVYEDDFVQNLVWTFSRANWAEIRHVIRPLESRFPDMKVNLMHKRNPEATEQKTTHWEPYIVSTSPPFSERSETWCSRKIHLTNIHSKSQTNIRKV